jgi:hypothetical protein
MVRDVGPVKIIVLLANDSTVHQSWQLVCSIPGGALLRVKRIRLSQIYVTCLAWVHSAFWLGHLRQQGKHLLPKKPLKVRGSYKIDFRLSE